MRLILLAVALGALIGAALARYIRIEGGWLW